MDALAVRGAFALTSVRRAERGSVYHSADLLFPDINAASPSLARSRRSLFFLLSDARENATKSRGGRGSRRPEDARLILKRFFFPVSRLLSVAARKRPAPLQLYDSVARTPGESRRDRGEWRVFSASGGRFSLESSAKK